MRKNNRKKTDRELDDTRVKMYKTHHGWVSCLTVNTDLKLSEITGLKMYFFTGLNAVLYVVPCNPSCDMIYQKF